MLVLSHALWLCYQSSIQHRLELRVQHFPTTLSITTTSVPYLYEIDMKVASLNSLCNSVFA